MASGLACKFMRLAKSSTFFKITRFRANLRAQWIETTNAESPPGSGSVAEEFIYGVFGGDVDCEVIYQLSDLVLASLTPGTNNSVTFYPDKLVVASSLTGSWAIETFEIVGEVKDAFKVRIAGKFNGGWTGASL